ncbi:MAG: sigma 54-interacting transcriptional regulator [Bilophila wadsworthia]
MQSELFGYDEGAFTGASRQGKPGKFELADGGTVFLDEIGEMPLEAQVSLLRLLQNREVTRVGGKSARRINIRVIAATNRNLEEAVRQNVFRHDLYYRLNAFLLSIPPLAARRGDVELLANHFLHKFSAALGKRVQAINAEARDLLYRYPWPGNVRELENAIERAVNVCGGQELMPCDFPSAMLEHEAVSGPGRKNGWLWAQETETIRKAIRETNGNLRQAAILLGISRSTLYLKIKKSNLSRDELLGPSPD